MYIDGVFVIIYDCMHAALPGRPTLHVDFFDNTFLVHWNQPNEGLTQISYYSIGVTGDECGTCDKLGNVSNVTNQLSCTGWEPNGQVCNVTVTAIASVCGIQQFISSSRLVYLKGESVLMWRQLTKVCNHAVYRIDLAGNFRGR